MRKGGANEVKQTARKDGSVTLMWFLFATLVP